jgi:anaerobic magnesium-protoporphyrin IX monomethyl ester cyclase
MNNTIKINPNTITVNKSKKTPGRQYNKRLWLDLGEFGVFNLPHITTEAWQDHGLALLRTILHKNQLMTDVASLRGMADWAEFAVAVKGYDMLLMNVRSYTYPFAKEAARIFKEVNPESVIITGGMHATVAPHEMHPISDFDHICTGGGEGIIVDLVRDPDSFPRIVNGISAQSLSDWPQIDRTLWPRPVRKDNWYPWPLEPTVGWAPGPVATVITSRVCPWQCSFCNESSYIPTMQRRTVDQVIDELNYLDETYGPLGSVVIHDSMFFQQPSWLEEWLEKYPKRANKVWPYWAAGRSDTVRKWPDLFEALVRETNWNTVSIGFESGSDRVLKILNKGCTVEDNKFAIDLLNKIGDDLVREGKTPPKFYCNIIFGTPGETPEDAFDTARMMAHMKYATFSVAGFAPYPGSALGNQLIAEGKSLMGDDNYHRFLGDEKVLGVDYDFYKKFHAGDYNSEIFSKLSEWGTK